MRQRVVVSDADAVRNVLGGRRDDFAILVHRYLPAMEALAYSATGSRQDAEDVVQEAFLRAFRFLDHLREPDRFGAWLGRIVKNTAQSVLRTRLKRATSVTDPTAQQAPVAPAVEQREIHAYLRREIGRLDEAYRDALLLHYFAGLPTGEIAKVLSISQGAVLKRLERGRKALGERLVDALGQGLQAQDRRFDEKASRALGVIAGVNAPWMTTAPAKAAPSLTLVQKLRSAVVQHKAAAFGVALLATTCAVFLTKGWPASASDIAQEVPAAATVEAVVDPPPSPPMPVLAQTTAEAPAPEPAVKAAPESQPPALPPRLEVPAGYPGQDLPEAQRHTVEGIVYDPQGRPLPGARVWAARAGSGVPDTRETSSDPQGRFALRMPDGRWNLMAAKGTLGGEGATGPEGAFVLEGSPSTPRMTVLTEERAILRGQLLDKESRKPVGRGSIYADNRRSIPVDEEGRFVIEGLRREDHTFLVISSGYERQYVLYSTALRPDTTLEVALNRGAKLAGCVTDQQGKPVANAWVRLMANSVGCTSGYFDVCDDQGRFEYEGAPLGRKVCVEAMWPCYINWCAQPMPGTTQWKGAVTASKADLNLVLPEGPVPEIRSGGTSQPTSSTRVKPASAVLQGRVLGPDGEPIRAFHIQLGLTRPSVPGQAYEIHYSKPGVLFTSEDGAFALTADVEPGATARVVASAEGYRDAVVEQAAFEPIASAQSTDGLTLRLGERAGLLTVKVVEAGAANHPVKDARVTLVEPYWDVTRDGLHLDRIGDPRDNPQYASSDADGNAQFADVALMEGVLRVEREGYALNGAGWDGRAQTITVELEPECILEGEVTTEDGTGPAQGEGAVILKGSFDGTFDLHESGAVYRVHSILPEHAGKFRITGLPPRRYALDITWQDGKASQTVYLGGTAEQPAVVTSKAGREPSPESGRINHRYFSDTFVLEAGETLVVSYPQDDVRFNPDRVAAQEAEVPADAALHRSLVGVWERPTTDPNGAQVCEVLHLSADGKLQTLYFVSGVPAVNRPGFVEVFSGSFSVINGSVNFYDERGHSWWEAPIEVRGNLVSPGGRTYTRNEQGLENAIRKAQATCGVSLETDVIPLSELRL